MAAWEELQKQDPANNKLKWLQLEIAKRFAVTVSDINTYLLRKILYLEGKTSTASLNMDLENREITIKFTPFTSRAEVIEQWDKFEGIRARMFPVNPTKRRTVQQPDLIYAIFKQRQCKKTFREIFNLYSEGKLPGYAGSPDQYKDEFSLKKYYQAGKPTL